ncbi:endo alpha-1,4 polygalactosaminidase [Thalassospira sp. MA62]|nr:endo alpha-1,4 polygalactosaminidase [Thalassospira sp. MA62]
MGAGWCTRNAVIVVIAAIAGIAEVNTAAHAADRISPYVMPAVPGVPNGPLHWQLQGVVTPAPDIRVVGVDLFDTDRQTVLGWRENGMFPICYINVGAREDWRDDANQFPSSVVGAPYWGWDGENWLDVGRFHLFADVITARFDLCRDKGFLGVEPDNIDGFEADMSDQSDHRTGFNISRSDQLRYVDWLIDQAHMRGLAIGQKNVGDLVPDLVDKMDFALLESAWRQGFMAEFSPYVARDKPVFAVEYRDEGVNVNEFCDDAEQAGFQGLVSVTELDRAPQNCP